MKKAKFFGFAGLLIVSFAVSGCALLGGLVPKKAVVQTVTAEVAEVADTVYQPRRNPVTATAQGDTYAVPASTLSPEAERLQPPVYAISGVKGQDIGEIWEAVDVVLQLRNKDTFAQRIPEGTYVTDWFANLPKGLEARAHGVRKGANIIKIYVSGKPEETRREEVKVSIPTRYITNGNAQQPFVSPTEAQSQKAWADELAASEL
jgi:putative protein kinase ArgK-like GTPase of G3E family